MYHFTINQNDKSEEKEWVNKYFQERIIVLV